MLGIRPATPSDIAPAATCLAAAFQRDPFSAWVHPSAPERPEGMRRVFEQRLSDALEEGSPVHVTNAVDGVAIWTSPAARRGESPPPERRVEVVEAFAAIAAAHPTAPHWYLDFLGAREGQAGRGSALITHMLATTDAAGLPTALWTGSRANLAFYGKHGYSVLQHLDFGDASAWWLWRDPR